MRRAYKFLLRPASKQAAALSACLEDHGQTLRRLDKAFAAFFRRVKAGDRKPGYPRFKGRGWFDSIEWPAEKNGARWGSVPHPAVTRVCLLGIGHVRVHGYRAVKGRVKTITAKREGSRWYVVLPCDDVPAEPLPATGKVRRSRLDHAHKTALALVRDYDVIAHEALNVANMTRRPAPRAAGDGTYEPNRAAAKAGLNRSILDAGWGVFLNILHAKAESAGRGAQCGHVATGNRVSQAMFRCLACGSEAHADVNAAINILKAGLALQGAEAA